jgi:hypothetical protein
LSDLSSAQSDERKREMVESSDEASRWDDEGNANEVMEPGMSVGLAA